MPDSRLGQLGDRTYDGPSEDRDVCECGHHITEHRYSEAALSPGECVICNDFEVCPGYAWREGRVEEAP